MTGVTPSPLADKADVIRGVTFSKGDAVAEPREGYIPVLRAGNIQSHLILHSDLVYIPKQMVSEKQRLRRGDIVMCTSSGSPEIVGKTAFTDQDWSGSFGAFCAVIRPKPGKCIPQYLFHYLQTPEFREWTRNSSGVGIKNIRKSELDSYEVPFLSLDEQRRIATILDKARAIRRKREQALAMADDFLRSMFFEMFGDLSSNDRQWPIKALGNNILHSNNGLSRRRKVSENVGQIVLRIQDIKPNAIDFGQPNRIMLDEKEKSRFRLENGDLLFVRVNGNPDYVGRCTVFRGYPEPVFHNDHIIRLRFDPEFDPEFLSFLFNLNIGRYLLANAIKTSAGQYTISQDGINDLKMPCPPPALQRGFHDVIAVVKDHRENLDTASEESNGLFSALSQRAFHGKL